MHRSTPRKLAMSPDNASSVVTYTSISSDSNGLSWGIPLVYAGELPEMDPYEEHVPLYVLEPEHPEYHAPSDDDIQDHIDYPADGENGDDEPSDDEDEEPTEDEEEEEHLALAYPSAVPVVDHVPSAGDTEAFETDESAPTPRSPQTRVPFSQTRLLKPRKTVKVEPSMSASMEARIVENAAAPIPPTSPAYD
ncbi:hypothetical protein Tco_1040397 [Tanacetum coccineum]